MWVDFWFFGCYELLWNGDIKIEGFMDKWIVFVIVWGSGCCFSLLVVF